MRAAWDSERGVALVPLTIFWRKGPRSESRFLNLSYGALTRPSDLAKVSSFLATYRGLSVKSGDPAKPYLASMGIYIFNPDVLEKALADTAQTDFGREIIPASIKRFRVTAYPFSGYWRDIGTIQAYWEANTDLVQVQPAFNLYNRDWPIHTYKPQAPPAKTVFNEPDGRQGRAMNSIVSSGCIISGAYVGQSILSPNVYVHSGADERQ